MVIIGWLVSWTHFHHVNSNLTAAKRGFNQPRGLELEFAGS